MLLILLVHLKFCWCILNFAGADSEVKCAPAKYMHQQYSAADSAGVQEKLPTEGNCVSLFFPQEKNEEQKLETYQKLSRSLPNGTVGMNDYFIVLSEHDVTASLSTFILPRLIQVSITIICYVGTR